MSNGRTTSIRINPQLQRDIDEIKVELNTDDMSEVIRRSLYFYRLCLQADKVKFVKDGFEERVLVK